MGWIFTGFIFAIAIELLIGTLKGYRKPEEHQVKKRRR
jgi:hypothetical protein